MVSGAPSLMTHRQDSETELSNLTDKANTRSHSSQGGTQAKHAQDLRWGVIHAETRM